MKDILPKDLRHLSTLQSRSGAQTPTKTPAGYPACRDRRSQKGTTVPLACSKGATHS